MSKFRTLTIFSVVLMISLSLSAVSFSMDIEDSIKTFNKGEREYRRGDYDDAIGLFNKVINKYPETALTEVAMYYLAKSYDMEGEKSMAKETYESLISKYPSGNWAVWAKDELEK